MIKKPADAPQDPPSGSAARSAPARTKAGRSASAMARRRHLFVEAYIANGNNASQAAIAAGTGGKQPRAEGWKLLKDPVVQDMLAPRAKQIAELAEMSTEAWARELRAISFSRVGDLLGPDGKLAPLAKLPDHVQAAISSVKATPDGEAIEYKFWDKGAALVTMARHLGLFERDNAQVKPDIKVLIELVGA
jgi:phage terminase small subunit